MLTQSKITQMIVVMLSGEGLIWFVEVATGVFQPKLTTTTIKETNNKWLGGKVSKTKLKDATTVEFQY